ncbi:MAG: hypothetical protein AB7Q27_02785 [Acidimicrobiia bacterium]
MLDDPAVESSAQALSPIAINTVSQRSDNGDKPDRLCVRDTRRERRTWPKDPMSPIAPDCPFWRSPARGVRAQITGSGRAASCWWC